MIQIILINGQVCDGLKEFSFWDTIYSQYISFNGEQMWCDERGFLEAFVSDPNNEYEVDRFIAKIPKEYKKQKI